VFAVSALHLSQLHKGDASWPVELVGHHASLPLAFAIGASTGVVLGFAYALVNMNHTRLAMVLAPQMGRSHFFALFSVVANLTLGLAPVIWGLLIDAFGARQFHFHGIELNRFSFFFCCVLLVFVAALVLCRRLEEPEARNMDELVTELLQSPQRLWLRLWPRG
jgi:MFS family permease